MKQKLWVVTVAGVLTSCAVIAGSLFSNDPAPKQMYRDVNSQPIGNVGIVKPSVDSAPPQAASPASAQGASTLNDNNSMVALNSSQVNSVRINQLSDKTNALTSQVAALNQRISDLSQQISQLDSTDSANTAEAAGQVSSWKQALHDGFPQMNEILYLSIGGGSVLLLGLGFLAGRSRREARQQPKSANLNAIIENEDKALDDDQETKAEYDFMATDEAIPAMLDLARSYLAMDNDAEAKAVLEKVLERGDKAHQEEAQSLLDQIAQNKDD